MPSLPSQIYEFASFRLDAAERMLSKGANAISLSPKVFGTLLLLLNNAGRVLSKETMLAEIWEDSFVEENNLAQNISVLRRLLGETRELKFIETVPKFGYRFIAPVNRADWNDPETEIFEQTRARVYIDDHSSEPIEAALGSYTPETHYVRNGDVNIAYQVVGEGEIDVVFVMGWISHLEYFWKHPLFASFLNRLASFSRLILFDKRGTGLSDRVPNNELPTLEQRMEDVHAVFDAVGSRRAVLIGVSEGGPMCSLFAATYPERTTALVMIGTYAKRTWDRDYPWAPTLEEREAFLDTIQNDWGTPVGIDERAPSMADDEEFREWWATYLRMGASPGAAVALTRMNAEIDVRDVLPSIRVPSLVIHRSGDTCLKVEEGRYVASQIRGCKYVELGGVDHLPFVGEQDEILDEIEQFLTGLRQTDQYERILATVMSVRFGGAFADEVGEKIHSLIELFKGRKVCCGIGEVLAAFDGPARAIRCAAAITDSVKSLGVSLKTGLHTGECDMVDGIYSGFAVELAREIASKSVGGDILVSRTVKDLVAGSGLEFKEFGAKALAGVDGKWRLFTVRR